MNELRLTETNSADDSDGKTWGFEGNLFWHLIGGIFAAVIVLLLLFSVAQWTITASASVAAIPLSLSLTYIFGFRQGKPAGYDRDILELWISGPGFGPDARQPLEERCYV
ncbi:MAG: hypothetical protein JWL59_4850 [Chthoniobacteraceae bacterium]|nr:hypothetical protein [Chthoniobacteraceae bacterium]